MSSSVLSFVLDPRESSYVNIVDVQSVIRQIYPRSFVIRPGTLFPLAGDCVSYTFQKGEEEEYAPFPTHGIPAQLRTTSGQMYVAVPPTASSSEKFAQAFQWFSDHIIKNDEELKAHGFNCVVVRFDDLLARYSATPLHTGLMACVTKLREILSQIGVGDTAFPIMLLAIAPILPTDKFRILDFAARESGESLPHATAPWIGPTPPHASMCAISQCGIERFIASSIANGLPKRVSDKSFIPHLFALATLGMAKACCVFPLCNSEDLPTSYGYTEDRKLLPVGIPLERLACQFRHGLEIVLHFVLRMLPHYLRADPFKDVVSSDVVQSLYNQSGQMEQWNLLHKTTFTTPRVPFPYNTAGQKALFGGKLVVTEVDILSKKHHTGVRSVYTSLCKAQDANWWILPHPSSDDGFLAKSVALTTPYTLTETSLAMLVDFSDTFVHPSSTQRTVEQREAEESCITKKRARPDDGAGAGAGAGAGDDDEDEDDDEDIGALLGVVPMWDDTASYSGGGDAPEVAQTALGEFGLD